MDALANELWQHAVVTLAAIAAGALIVRRVLGFVAQRDATPRCANCQPGPHTCGPAAPAKPDATHPVVFIRSAR